MSELAPTLSNFDAIVAANTAKAEAPPEEAPDTFENDSPSEVDEAPEQDEPEEVAAAGEDDAGDEDYDSDEQRTDPTVEPVDQALRAPFKAFRESLKAKRLTPELMSALGDMEMEFETVNGPVKMRVQEMAGHVMREARFTREMQKAKEIQASADRIHQIERARTNAWRQNPAELEQGLEIMGCTPALEHVFMKWARDKHAYLSASPEQRQAMDQAKHWQRVRQQEQMQFQQLRQENERLKQQGQQAQFDEPTRQAGDYINQNMDRILGGALKSAGGGRINNDLRLAFINEATELAQEGYPLPQALAEAGRTVAEQDAKMQRIARGQAAERAKAKPEVSGRKAPAGNAPPKRDEGGRFQAPKTNGKRKTGATAAEFARRFGV